MAAMLVPNRFSILLSAALAVASPFAAAVMAWGYVDEHARGLGYLLLYWPVLLANTLPPGAVQVLMASGFILLVLYFCGYLLVCHAVRLLWRRLR